MYHVAGLGWETAADFSTAVGTAVALVGVVVGMVFTRRSEKLTREGQDLERRHAEATAARSEAAAALTEEYTLRVVEALETMAGAAGTPATTGELTRRGVRWNLAHHSGDTFILTNIGNETARSVRVSAHETMIMRPPDEQDLEPGEAQTFLAAMSLATKDSTIRVEWVEGDDGERQTWKYPLPPRPPRKVR